MKRLILIVAFLFPVFAAAQDITPPFPIPPFDTPFRLCDAILCNLIIDRWENPKLGLINELEKDNASAYDRTLQFIARANRRLVSDFESQQRGAQIERDTDCQGDSDCIIQWFGNNQVYLGIWRATAMDPLCGLGAAECIPLPLREAEAFMPKRRVPLARP
jgi:hypothetical protein